MIRRRLCGWRMKTREQAHAHIKKRLCLPDYYGGNLDALSDCLSEMGTPTEIVLTHAGYMRKKLGEYGVKLISVLLAATGENPRVHVCVREKW